MKHVLLLLFSFVILIGAWAAFYTHQISKNRRTLFLRDYVHYIICHNLTIAYYQVAEYIYINLLGNDLNNMPVYLCIIFFLIALIIQISMAWTFLRTVVGLNGKSISPKGERIFFGSIILIGINFIIGATLLIQSNAIQWLQATVGIQMMMTIGLIAISLIVLLLQKQKDHRLHKKKAIRAFGYLYLGFYIPMMAAGLFPGTASVIVVSVMISLSNFIPFIWLNYWLPKYTIATSLPEDLMQNASNITGHKISKREKEIIQLILEGKSNKEIEAALFISFNTVKNHIYRLYQKLGVNSRGQLVRLILEAQNKQ